MPRLTLSTTAQIEKNIRNALKNGMLEKDWSNEHLAKLLGMYPSNLSKIINRPMSVQLGTICRIAEKLGIKDLPIK